MTNVHAFCHENYSLTDVLHMRGHAFKRAVNTDEFQSVSELELSGLQALHCVAERFIDFCGHNRAPSDQRSCTLRIKQTYAGNHVVAHYAQESVQTKERRDIGQSGLRQRLDELAELADTLGGIADFVAHALKVSRHAVVAEEQTQVHRLRLTPRNDGFQIIVEFSFPGIDDMIFRHHFGGFICIQIHERIAQSAELLLDSAGHLNNVVVEFFELSVKALHRMCLGFHLVVFPVG